MTRGEFRRWHEENFPTLARALAPDLHFETAVRLICVMHRVKQPQGEDFVEESLDRIRRDIESKAFVNYLPPE